MTTFSDPVAMLIRDLGDIAMLADVLIETLDVDTADPEPFVRILCAIRDTRADLASVYDTAERRLLERMGDRSIVIEGLGLVEAHRNTKRTQWQTDQLLSALIRRIVDEPETVCDTETGEIHDPARLAHQVVARLRECVSIGAGKVTGLREIGIDPDEYCTTKHDGHKVQLPPRKTEVAA